MRLASQSPNNKLCPLRPARRLYGQNNVDSGRGNDIIDRDELSVSAM